MDAALTVEEVAEILRVSGHTVRRYIRNGQLAAALVDGQYQIRTNVIEAYIAANTCPAAVTA